MAESSETLFQLVRDVRNEVSQLRESFDGAIDAVEASQTAAHRQIYDAINAAVMETNRVSGDLREFKGRVLGALATMTVLITLVTVGILISDHLP